MGPSVCECVYLMWVSPISTLKGLWALPKKRAVQCRVRPAVFPTISHPVDSFFSCRSPPVSHGPPASAINCDWVIVNHRLPIPNQCPSTLLGLGMGRDAGRGCCLYLHSMMSAFSTNTCKIMATNNVPSRENCARSNLSPITGRSTTKGMAPVLFFVLRVSVGIASCAPTAATKFLG